MKLLLDESVPRQLNAFFPNTFEVRTVQRMSWAGSKNSDLLRLAAAHGFDAFITASRNAYISHAEMFSLRQRVEEAVADY